MERRKEARKGGDPYNGRKIDSGRQGSNSVLMGDVDSDSDDEDAPRGNNLITGVEVLIDSAQKARAVSMSSDDL